MAIDSTIRSPRDGFLAPFKLLVLPNSSPFSLSSRVHTAFPLNSLRSLPLSLSLCQSTGRREPTEPTGTELESGPVGGSPRASEVLYRASYDRSGCL